jgi:hypothetical protein
VETCAEGEEVIYYSYDKIKLSCDESDILTMAWAVLNSYASDQILRDHWQLHGVVAWKNIPKASREIARTLFASVGRLEVLESKEQEAERLLNKLCEEREKGSTK